MYGAGIVLTNIVVIIYVVQSRLQSLLFQNQ
jgi:hypothetical protein